MYAFPQPQRARRPLGHYMRGYLRGHLGRSLRGLDMNVNQTGPGGPTNYIYGPGRLGPTNLRKSTVVEPTSTLAPVPAPILAPAPAPIGGSTAQQVAGTPVSPGFSRNSIFVNSDGSQWIFSASQNMWIGVGTPYNVNAPAVAPAASTSTASGFYTNTPVPLSWPTGQVYTDTIGNQWAYNPGYGTFQMTPSAFSSFASGSSAMPAGGSTVVTTAPGANTAQSILDWSTQSTWIPGVPNWVMGVGLTSLALLFIFPVIKGRR